MALLFDPLNRFLIRFIGPCKGSDIVCSVCTCGISDPPNEIVICDNCGVGYHQNCHTPPILSNTLLLDADWYCRQCVFAFTARVRELQHYQSRVKCAF